MPKPKKKKNKAWSFFIAPSIFPAVLMVILTHALSEYFTNGAVKMAIAVLFGGIGEEISVLLTPRGVVSIIKLIVKGAEALGDISDTISELEVSTDKTKNKDTSETKENK